tara:strand:+ start:457 stop:675 length:219 start_codon:yes stop_codon:yes gene_type:complete
MKLTKEKLQQIIKEELGTIDEAMGATFADRMDAYAERILDHLNNKLPEEYKGLRATNWFISLESMINDLKRD